MRRRRPESFQKRQIQQDASFKNIWTGKTTNLFVYSFEILKKYKTKFNKVLSL